ncbi:MAG: class II fumarate hydratase [Pseudomonadota bacterium]
MGERREEDFMGQVPVPGDAWYGSQTARALETFRISGIPFPLACIRAVARIKRHMAEAHLSLGLLPGDLAESVIQAAREVEEGGLADQFVVDVFQTGSGTSSHMNANEVIAGRANEILTGQRGGKSPVHPNDHVNLGQSTNDVIPTAIRLSTALALERDLVPALASLAESLRDKAREFDRILKIGRTHFQDAVPMRLSSDFSAWARQVELGLESSCRAVVSLLPLPLGGTAVGSGVNAHPDAAPMAIRALAEDTGMGFFPAPHRLEAQGSGDAYAASHAALRNTALSLMKIAQDLRFLSSGPRSGIGELSLPALLPGSSFMPGKINPVACEVVLQAGAQVLGNDAAVAAACQAGGLELFCMQPLCAHNLLFSATLLSNSARMLDEQCVRGIRANEARMARGVEDSPALATLLAPRLGYDLAADLARRALASGRTVRDLAVEEGILTPGEWEDLLGKL